MHYSVSHKIVNVLVLIFESNSLIMRERVRCAICVTKRSVVRAWRRDWVTRGDAIGAQSSHLFVTYYIPIRHER